MPDTPKADAAVARLELRIRDLEPFRLLIVELTALLSEMEPSPERDRLAHALERLTANLPD